MKDNYELEVKKTAKVSVYKGSSKQIDKAWLVLHGYGQLSNYFLEKFTKLENDRSLIVAPEGLHRYYVNGFTGRVGASWMTKEERESDIRDYIQYLEQVYEKFIAPHSPKKVHLLGFSQGTATACRWLCKTTRRIDSLILWAGMMPPDLRFNTQDLASWPKTILAFDPNDQFHNSVAFQKQLSWLKQQGIDYKTLTVDCGHNINDSSLASLLQYLE